MFGKYFLMVPLVTFIPLDPAAAIELEVQVSSGMQTRPGYTQPPEGVQVVAAGIEQTCLLSTVPQKCTIDVPDPRLLFDVEVRLRYSPSSVYGQQYTLEPLRFTIVRKTDEEMKLQARLTPAIGRLNNRLLVELYAKAIENSNALAVHEYYQDARQQWLEQKALIDQGSNPSGWSTIAAFVALKSAYVLGTQYPPFRADKDLAITSAASYIEERSPEHISRALAKVEKSNLADEAIKYARFVRMSVSKPLSDAWQWLRLRPERERLKLLSEFSDQFDSALSGISSIRDRTEIQSSSGIGISRALVHDSEAEMLALLYRCGQIDDDEFESTRQRIVEYLGTEIRASSTSQMPEPIPQACSRPNLDTSTEKYCATIHVLEQLSRSAEVSRPAICP